MKIPKLKWDGTSEKLSIASIQRCCRGRKNVQQQQKSDKSTVYDTNEQYWLLLYAIIERSTCVSACMNSTNCFFIINSYMYFNCMDCCYEYRDHRAIYPHTHCFNLPQIAFHTVLGILFVCLIKNKRQKACKYTHISLCAQEVWVRLRTNKTPSIYPYNLINFQIASWMNPFCIGSSWSLFFIFSVLSLSNQRET